MDLWRHKDLKFAGVGLKNMMKDTKKGYKLAYKKMLSPWTPEEETTEQTQFNWNREKSRQ